MTRRLIPILLATLALAGAANAQAADAGRGRLLYETGCNACHTQQPHWRDKRLATDPARLAAEVRRWAGIAGMGWSEEDVQDVVAYLDEAFYHLPAR